MTAMAVVILTLSPIIFGFSEDAAWGFPWKLLTTEPSAFFKLTGVLVVVGAVLLFVPLFRHLDSLQPLVLGGIVLVFTLMNLYPVDFITIKGRVDFIPSFWFSTGLIMIGGIMSGAGVMVAALIVKRCGCRYVREKRYWYVNDNSN
ncbi:MAG: hypothetical protein L3J83_10500 [Proteobacteria bacterium]|nr:hypothetical protein [Pseudomonadota bacterium]